MEAGPEPLSLKPLCLSDAPKPVLAQLFSKSVIAGAAISSISKKPVSARRGTGATTSLAALCCCRQLKLVKLGTFGNMPAPNTIEHQ